MLVLRFVHTECYSSYKDDTSDRPRSSLLIRLATSRTRCNFVLRMCCLAMSEHQNALG